MPALHRSTPSTDDTGRQYGGYFQAVTTASQGTSDQGETSDEAWRATPTTASTVDHDETYSKVTQTIDHATPCVTTTTDGKNDDIHAGHPNSDSMGLIITEGLASVSRGTVAADPRAATYALVKVIATGADIVVAFLAVSDFAVGTPPLLAFGAL